MGTFPTIAVDATDIVASTGAGDGEPGHEYRERGLHSDEGDDHADCGEGEASADDDAQPEPAERAAENPGGQSISIATAATRSPAWSGVNPSTSWKRCVVTSWMPPMANIAVAAVMIPR